MCDIINIAKIHNSILNITMQLFGHLYNKIANYISYRKSVWWIVVGVKKR